MFGLEIIEVAIGLVFAYLVLSMVCSGIFEVWSRITKLRAKSLETALQKLLADPKGEGFVKRLYDHYLIRSPLAKQDEKPEHIKAEDFATAVFDLLAKDATDDKTRLAAIRAAIGDIPDDLLKRRLSAILEAGERRLDSAREVVERWFDNSMEAVTIWYRKRSQVFVLVCAAAVTIGFNADSVRLGRTLWNDDALRASMVGAADAYADELNLSGPGNAETLAASLEEFQNKINDARMLPIGWTTDAWPWQADYKGPSPLAFWVLKLVGWLLTIGAVSMGSSYWYAVLRKLLDIASRRREQGPTVIVAPAAAGGGNGGGSVNA